jgi:hypothetical protein
MDKMEKLFFSVALVFILFSSEASAASVSSNPESYVGKVVNFNNFVDTLLKS